MANDTPRNVTRVLEAIRAGDERATDRLLMLVYDQLRALAQRQMAGEPAGHTLQATALVHEAYLRILGDEEPTWNSRGHFYAAAAQAMRRILVERARRVRRLRHGGGRPRLTIDRLDVAVEERDGVDFVALDAALRKLHAIDPRAHDVAMLRYFAGLTIDQTALVLELPARQVRRHWDFARLWLYRDVTGDG